MVSLKEAEYVVDMALPTVLKAWMVFVFIGMVGALAILLPLCWLSEAGIWDWRKRRPPLDSLFDWHELPRNSACFILSLLAYAEAEPGVYERLEGYFHRHGWRVPLVVTNAMAKLHTSGEDMQKQKVFISEMRRLEAREVWFAQYHGMADEMSRKQHETGPSDESTADHTHKSTKLQKVLDETLRDWSAINKKRRQQWQTRPNGAWVREEYRKTPRDIYEEGKQTCKRVGGCCAYSCGCCEKSGRSSLGLQLSHCSEWCECCCERRGYVINLDEEKN